MVLQESVKSKHPQLLYESKLYKLLQGASECPLSSCTACQSCPAPACNAEWTCASWSAKLSGSSSHLLSLPELALQLPAKPSHSSASWSLPARVRAGFPHRLHRLPELPSAGLPS